MVDRLGVGAAELKRRVFEGGLRRDQVDRLPLDNLVAEHVHQPPALEARPHAAGRLARLGRHSADLFVVIGRRIGDPLVLGNPFENEVLLQRPRSARHDGLPKLVDVPADRIVVETTAPQLEDCPLKLPLGLATQQGRRQLP